MHQEAALCADPTQHGIILVQLQERITKIEELSEQGDARIKEQIETELDQMRHDIAALRDDLQATERKADKILDLTISIERLTAQVGRMEDKVEGLLSSKRLGVTTVISILQAIVTAAVLVWLGLK